MIQEITHRIIAAILQASGSNGSVECDTGSWEWKFNNSPDGGVWTIKVLQDALPHFLMVAYQPPAPSPQDQDAFTLRVQWNGHQADAEMDYRPEELQTGMVA